MALLNLLSLADTLNSVHDAFFFSRAVALSERKRVATWIAGRHGQPGAYAGTFALLPDEQRDGIRLFTGERVTNAAARHIAGEEACRALRLLDVRSPGVRAALDAAAGSLRSGVGPLDRAPDGRGHWLSPFQGGVFCCGQCSVALWRHILCGGWDHAAGRLTRGMRCLRTCRKPDGTWRIFPFWYTMLALSEIDLPEAVAEIRHGRARLELHASRRSASTPFAVRRQEVARRALARL